MKINNLYQAKAVALPFVDDPIGELYEDMYIVPIKDSTTGTVKNHLVQSGKFYIRESFFNNEDFFNPKHIDIMIDPETLVDVTDYEMPIFVGCDLARDLDVTFINGEYLK